MLALLPLLSLSLPHTPHYLSVYGMDETRLLTAIAALATIHHGVIARCWRGAASWNAVSEGRLETREPAHEIYREGQGSLLERHDAVTDREGGQVQKWTPAS
jgi:hypothetical protein